MKNAEPEKDSGGLVPLVRKSLSEVTGGVGLNPRFSPSHAQLNDHAGHLLRNYGLPASTLPHPFHLAAISSRVYPPSLFGAGLNPAALLASLSRTNNLFRNTPTSDYPIIPPSSSHSLANLHAVLATGDPCRHSELLKNSARQHELLSALTKVAASTSSTSPLSPSTSTSPLSTSFNLTSSNGSPSKLSKDTSPLDKFSRASSLSPSSYMTPRSLNGSPSGPASNTPNFNSLVHSSSSLSTLESLSPTSPSTEGEGSGNSLSSGATPTRKVSTPRPDRVFTCKICSRSFGYKHVLQNHERTHTGEKPFECKECHKRFTRDHHLKTHMRLHTGEKPYHCTHCDRQFVQVANLRRHLRVHTGEKPYTCETCSSKFSDSNQLKAHILIHKGEKPFGCNKCSGKFRRRHHLIHHKCPNGLDSHFNDTPVTMLPDNYNFSFDDSLYHNDIEDEDIDDRMHLPSSTSMLGSTNEDEPLRMGKRRVRKCKEPRRIVSDVSPRLSSPSLTDTILNTLMPLTPQPEQTEPEDLSINGSRRDYQNHMYRANIALTSSRYMKSPFKYPSSIADHQDLSQNKEFGAISGQL